jgi:cephalosporin hydroxylase
VSDRRTSEAAGADAPVALDVPTLQRILLQLAAGDAQGAAALLGSFAADGVADAAAELLGAAPDDEKARALGDTLAAAGAEQDVVNEAYRAAFYLGGMSESLAMENPLYAYFLGHRSGPAIDKWVHYFSVYHRHLERYRDHPVRVLEIGVYRGGGLHMWQKYFGHAATIVGLDVDEAARTAAGGDFVVELGDQADPAVLRRIAAEHGPFDVVIDDGGHTMAQQRTTVDTLFPLLAEGGTLVVEDCHTSYWPEYDGGLRRPGTFVEWVKSRVDDLHARYTPEIRQDTVWATHLDGVHLYDSIVILDKKTRFRPFSEMSGTSAYLRADRPSEGQLLDLIAARDAARLQVEALEQELSRLGGAAATPVARVVEDPITEELRVSQAALRRTQAELVGVGRELEDLKREIASTNGRLLESWEQIHQMRRSISWRLTAPIRAVRSRMR